MRPLRRLHYLIIGMSLVGTLRCAAAVDQGSVEVSITVRESLDDNVFLVSGAGAPKQEAWVTAMTPKVLLNLTKAIQGIPLESLTLTYSPEVTIYHEASSEDFIAHRLTSLLKLKSGPSALNFEASAAYVDGSTAAPIYSVALHDDQRNAYSTSAVRERREQLQLRSKLTYQYDLNAWFVRAGGTWISFDLMTDVRALPGYQNYCDRSDFNGGLDIGRKLKPGFAITLGYRHGHQSQQLFPVEVDKSQSSSPSNYDRILLGLEGNLTKWLTTSVLIGPDFRSYPPTTGTHVTMVPDSTPQRSYFEAGVSANLSPNDTLTFKGKRWYWVASTGKVPLIESSWELAYRRRLGTRLTFDASTKLCISDYSCGIGSSALRNDELRSTAVGTTFAATKVLSLSATLTIERGRNALDDLQQRLPLQNPKFREFDHRLFSLAASYKF